MKSALAAAVVVLLAGAAVVISTNSHAPEAAEVSFAGIRTNAAFYRVPLPNWNRSIRLDSVQRLREAVWTNEVTLRTERVVGDPTLVWVPLSAGGTPPRPGDVCRVVGHVASQSWSLRLNTLLRRMKQRGAAPFHFDRFRWFTNEVYIPQAYPSERAHSAS